LRGTGRHLRRARLRAAAAAVAVLALAGSLAACGGSSSETEEASGPYEVAVTEASFPTLQRLGQTSLLRLGIRNTGGEAVPALTVTVGIQSEQGRNSALPFGVRDPQPELAAADRPVWVLAATYPRFVGSAEPGGATTANPKTFDFGTLEPGETTEAVWKLSAVRAGRYPVAYEIGAGGAAEAETEEGVQPGGSFVVRITPVGPETEVTDSGKVVEAPARR
jgi:hypothetical protein